MEVLLNNVWMALTTPNSGVVNLLSIPLLLIENCLCFLLFSSVLNVKFNTKQKLIYILSVPIEAFICMNFIPIPYNTFLNYFFITFLIYKLSNLNLVKSIFAAILPPMAFGLLGLLISNPYLTILQITAEDLVSIPIYRITYNHVYICFYTCFNYKTLQFKY